MIKETLTLLGSTGSIGRSALDVVARHPNRYEIFALTANDNVDLLAQQCAQFRPKYAALADTTNADALRAALAGLDVNVLAGPAALSQVVCEYEVDTVIAGIVGIAGLQPILEAARNGKRILLANKEALVVAGQFVMPIANENGATIVPIDSEHNAVLQCLQKKHRGVDVGQVKKITLTASGGPFLQLPAEQLSSVTPEQACKHPNWDMGAKISVDSATLLNKGLEVIEAHWLFDIPIEKIDVLIHPQSIVHALVEYNDGAVVAQMSKPDMRVAIAYALSGSQRMDSGVESLDLAKIRSLEFGAVDYDRFPCFGMAHQAFRNGPKQVIALNAANEIAVAGFLDRKLKFNQIQQVIEATCTRLSGDEPADVDAIVALDTEARARAKEFIDKL